MRKLLVFQHVPFEPLGTLDRRFRHAGFRIRYANFHRQPDTRVDVGRYHGLVVLGGPMSADQTDRHGHLGYEREAIRRAVGLGIPVLGICLGAQLIALSLGGRSLRGRTPVFGWSAVSPTAAGREDPLIGHFKGRERIFQWHSDTFALPPDCVHLARSRACEQQAFRYGDHVYGFQFHLEADRALIRRWLGTRKQLEELERQGTRLDPEVIDADTNRLMPRAAQLSSAVFGEFIDRFYGLRRRLALPSR
jgi:GMP synthase (glutamine-hydrolysing)